MKSYLLFIALLFMLLSCGMKYEKSLKNDDFLSSENYKYQSFPKNKYELIIKKIIINNPMCGTRAEVANLIGETKEFGKIRLLLLCTKIQDKKVGDTILFLPIKKPDFDFDTDFYLKKDLTNDEIDEIINTPTTFATLLPI